MGVRESEAISPRGMHLWQVLSPLQSCAFRIFSPHKSRILFVYFWQSTMFYATS